MNTLYSNEAQQAVNLGMEHHWRFRVVDKRGTIDEPLPREGWWFYPATKNAVIPRNAQKRINVLEESGVKIQQVIIGHEASRLLKAPPKAVPFQFPTKPIKKAKRDPIDLTGVFTVVGAVAKVAFSIAAATLGLTVTLMGYALGTVLLLDPTVIVVLEDGTWLECMSWYE